MRLNFNNVSFAIDEFGERFKPTADEIHRRLGSRLPPKQFMTYAVTRMGWIAVQKTRRRLCAVYDRASVGHLALVALLDCAWRVGKPVVLNEDCRGNTPTVWESHQLLGKYLSELVERRNPQNRMWRSELSLAKSPFAATVRTATELLYSHIEPVTQARLLDSLFGGRFSLNKLDVTNGHFRVQSFGDEIAKHDPDFAASHVGATHHTFVDPQIGRWIADAFAEMAMHTGVKVEEAHLSHPSTGPLDYHRLLVPFTRGSDKLLLAASVLIE